MWATQVPTLSCRVASPITSAVAIASLLTSAQNTASNPASSAALAMSCVSLARQPAPGIRPSPNLSGINSSPHDVARGWLRDKGGSLSAVSAGREAEQTAGKDEMRLVDHPAVEGQG